jgi:DNA modification methylase
MTTRITCGDCRDVLRTLPANSVHACVTSPPYFGLRDYGTGTWDGGDPQCKHAKLRSMATSGLQGGKTTTLQAHYYREQCVCGARRVDRQIGLEETPQQWIDTLVGVMREVRRVLRPDATCFMNVGDSYQDKQLLMMPARLALALQADGWWLRSDIIWAKRNPMPESISDRPTSAHEHVFLLAKSARYFFDQEAVREPLQESSMERGYAAAYFDGIEGAKMQAAGSDVRAKAGWRANAYMPSSRNIRNVWTLATEAYHHAHFATFPTALAERCIRAGTSERGVCAQCGAPWVRQTERSLVSLQATNNLRSCDQNNRGDMPRMNVETTTTGWAPGCNCPERRTVPATVCDPFCGAGTTLLVADRLQRHGIGIELNAEYCRLARERITGDLPLFADVAD